MQLPLAILAAIVAITPVSAFTNGALVPSYICNPQNDGLPKKFSDVLAKTMKKVRTYVSRSTKLETNPALGHNSWFRCQRWRQRCG